MSSPVHPSKAEGDAIAAALVALLVRIKAAHRGDSPIVGAR